MRYCPIDLMDRILVEYESHPELVLIRITVERRSCITDLENHATLDSVHGNARVDQRADHVVSIGVDFTGDIATRGAEV